MDSKLFPTNDDNPSHDVAEGQKFMKEVYEMLRSSAQWNKMLFLITYDEHGVFFDHIPTPMKDVPSPDDIIGLDPFFFKFDRLGVRVPTIVISPWIDKGIGFDSLGAIFFPSSIIRLFSITLSIMHYAFKIHPFFTNFCTEHEFYTLKWVAASYACPLFFQHMRY